MLVVFIGILFPELGKINKFTVLKLKSIKKEDEKYSPDLYLVIFSRQ